MNSSIWKYELDPATITQLYMTNNMIGLLGIQCVEIGPDFIKATMPVDERTKQSAGLLHGGANVTLAESIGSLAANFCVNQQTNYAVGLEINANHIRTKHSGIVTGIAKPIHLGRMTQIWEIKIQDELANLLCIVRHTVAVLPKSEADKMHFNLPLKKTE
jgi:1,4-dihydroxy-2-naphthoyl-CoA hydrolase